MREIKEIRRWREGRPWFPGGLDHASRTFQLVSQVLATRRSVETLWRPPVLLKIQRLPRQR